MKNILLENMLRFGTKNLSIESQQNLQNLAEAALTNGIEFLFGPTIPQTFNKPTFFLSTQDPRNPILYIHGTGADSTSVAIARSGMIYDGKTWPFTSSNMSDFVIKTAMELFGSLRNSNAEQGSTIAETLRALVKAKTNADMKQLAPGLVSLIENILTTCVNLGKMDYEQFMTQKLPSDTRNNSIPFYNGVRLYLGLPNNAADVMANKNK